MSKRLVIMVCLALACGAASDLFAQEPKQPPPLFPKHRRGIYRNGQNIEVIDATPQSPPLATDDPGVPDEGEYEVNFTSSADFNGPLHNFDVLFVDANYGLVLHGFGHELPSQLKLEFPYAARTESGAPSTSGLGGAVVGMKFNFYNDENTGLRIAVYPQLAFASDGAVKKELAEPGQTLELPLLISKEIRYATISVNAGIGVPLHDSDRGTSEALGVGIGRAMTRKLALMADVRTESSVNFREDRLFYTDVGAIYGVRNAITYVRVGRSFVSDDGAHTYVGVGMKLVLNQKD